MVCADGRSEGLEIESEIFRAHGTMAIDTIEGAPSGRAVDSIVLSSGLARLVGTVTGPVTAVLILRFLSLEEQGYWYTFLGLIVMVSYAELGMGQVIMQFAAYEWGALKDGGGTAESHNWFRLKSIFRTTLLFGLLTATAELALAVTVGYLVLSGRANVGTEVHWLGPWLFLAVVAPLNITLAFLNSFLEGCQMIVASNLRRSAQSLAQVLTVFAVFSLGGKLWALGVGQLASFLFGIIVIGLTQGLFVKQMLDGFRSNTQVSWRREIWPLQWRYAAGWATGPLTQGLFNPLIFALAGPEAAGRFGFTFSIVGVLSAYSQMWTASRAAVFTRLNAGKRWVELKSLFERSVKHSIVTYAVAVAALLVGLYIVNSRYPSVAARLLDPLSTLLLVAGSGFALLTFFITYFVRSFKEEPFVRMAWINAAVVVTLLPAGILLFHARGASVAYLVSQSMVFPVAWRIYTRYRNRMRLQSNQASALDV